MCCDSSDIILRALSAKRASGGYYSLWVIKPCWLNCTISSSLFLLGVEACYNAASPATRDDMDYNNEIDT